MLKLWSSWEILLLNHATLVTSGRDRRDNARSLQCPLLDLNAIWEPKRKNVNVFQV